MADATQAVLTVAMPTLAVLVGILVNNIRLSDLKSHIDMRFAGVDQRLGSIDRRFDSLREVIDAGFADLKADLLRVEQAMDARLRHLEANR
jgi:hypothetical protein